MLTFRPTPGGCRPLTGLLAVLVCSGFVLVQSLWSENVSPARQAPTLAESETTKTNVPTASESNDVKKTFGDLLTKAKAGDVQPLGEYYLGPWILYQRTGDRDDAEAVQCFRKSAEKNNARAQYYFGVCYFRGFGVETNHAEAVKWYRKAAEQNDPRAQRNLAGCYWNGDGVTQDYAEAVKWFRKAADQGDADAQVELGACYHDGRGVNRDYAEAVKLFRKAADQEHPYALSNLGICYNHGRGVETNASEAVKWFRKASELGNANGQLELGIAYYNGRGVNCDYAEAAKLFRKAADQGHQNGACYLALCYANGQGVETNQVEAVKWYRKAADQGSSSAQYNLAWCYRSGRGVTASDTDAVEWFRKAAEQGNDNAQLTLGDCYRDGKGTRQDFDEAEKWYRKASTQTNAVADLHLEWLVEGRDLMRKAKTGDIKAQKELATYYELGMSYSGIPKDLNEALKWRRKAAEQGDLDSQTALAFLYYSGRDWYRKDFGQDYTEAMKWWRKAAEQGDADSQACLADGYAERHGVAQDFDSEAAKWYGKAAEQGLASAQHNLGLLYYQGKGVPQSYPHAARWYRRAADQGHILAQTKLAICYYDGNGVPRDYVEAYKWYNLAGSQGHKDAAKFRDQVAELMTAQQVAEGQRRASLFVARLEKQDKRDAITRTDDVDKARGNGTGFFIVDGYLLTSHHVVKEASAIRVVIGESKYTAKVLKADPANDIALLKVIFPPNERRPLQVLPLLTSRDMRLGDGVFTIGFPNITVQGVQPKLTRGEINSLAGIQDDVRFFQMNVAVQPGNSGGPLMDLLGNVVGIVTMRLDDAKTFEISGALPQNVNYAVKSSFIMAFLDSVPELTGKLKPPSAEKARKFEDVVKEVQSATALVLVY